MAWIVECESCSLLGVELITLPMSKTNVFK